MKQIDECHEILADPYGYAERFKAESGRKIVGTFCSYAPEEFIIAAGAHPFRIFGTGEKARLAESHLQSYCCSLVRGALEDALGGRLAFLDGVVFPHTCDTIQRLSDIWRLNVGGCFPSRPGPAGQAGYRKRPALPRRCPEAVSGRAGGKARCDDYRRRPPGGHRPHAIASGGRWRGSPGSRATGRGS